MVSVGKHIVLLKQKKKNDMEYVYFFINVFSQNENTVPVIDAIGAYPDELKAVMNINNRK